MNTHIPSLRDLESIDSSTLNGRSELRLILIDEFKIQPDLADWVIHLVEQSNDRLELFQYIDRIKETLETQNRKIQ